ncbi:hypothetical protein ACFOOP_14300 [Marinicaulis aureus]|uniref:Uncharacterized protein n=1 Tax=Hyphococcus aureus TaxID=2666033 RepID=A0ABW1L0N5_9PROT
MSRMDVTTQELFLRLGTTSQSRSARADALFRRLRHAEQEQLSADLMRAPKRLDVANAQPAEAPKALRRT